MLDIILGIVVYLAEEDYTVSLSNASLIKQDLISRLLLTGNNLSKFHKMISIFEWNKDGMDHIGKLEIADIAGKFLVSCNKLDYITMLAVQKFWVSHGEKLKTLSESDKKGRLKLLKSHLYNPYSENGTLNNSLVELFLGHLYQIEFGDRNKYIH